MGFKNFPSGLYLLLLSLIILPDCTANVEKEERTNLKAAAACEEIIGDDHMNIAGGIFPRKVSGQEGKLRATALVLEKGDTRLCIVSCDVLVIGRNIVDEICNRIEAECGIPFNNILVSATHTHHAPAVTSTHGRGFPGDPVFVERLKDAVVLAVIKANNKLASNKNALMYFRLGQEATIGQDSRLLLSDSTINWSGRRDDVIRPTGPYDPGLPVISLKDQNDNLIAMIFNHSTHNIGSRRSGVRSPGFYGLAAQELEEEIGGTCLFLLGACGSVHSLDLTTDEKIYRIKQAVIDAYQKSSKKDVTKLLSIKEEYEYHVREFDDAKEQKDISYYCKTSMSGPMPLIDSVIEVFRQNRKDLMSHQGEIRKTWLQIMVIGEVAIVGIGGEFFADLGIQIKRLSPYRYTYIVELANDYIGYIPDKKGFELGGYQAWTGYHGIVAKGTGEAIVEKIVQLLSILHKENNSTFEYDL